MVYFMNVTYVIFKEKEVTFKKPQRVGSREQEKLVLQSVSIFNILQTTFS